MGEAKNEAEAKKPEAAAADKKDDGPITVVLKLDMHCQGCAKKIKRVVRRFEGIYVHTQTYICNWIYN
ncbi:unnamed protein product [Thlaspi arvense]|uniref:HMA domain-containing protein n=1 Tax=Thlaspi arvense TaxID=13288 RepID=A0AAU9RM15_THLAR|nr:unnamed protein product [Thlaspi arvense]